MVHYGKEPSGDLNIIVSADNVGQVYDLLDSAGGGMFGELRRYILENFPDELAAHRRRQEELEADGEYALKKRKHP